MKHNSFNEYKVLLITLISSLTITGIGFIDNQIWNTIFAVLGIITYGIVGLLYSAHLISGKRAGKDAFAIIFIILILVGFYVYEGIIEFQKWLISWPLWCKILIPILLTTGIIITIILMMLKNKHLNNNIQENKNSHE